MVEKYKLRLAVGVTVLLITIWLVFARRVWDWVGQTLLACSVALIVWTAVLRKKEPARLLEFFLKSLIVSYMVTSVFWFVMLGVTSPWYYAFLNQNLLMNILIFTVLPLALLPVAISVLVYGIFRIRLKAWEFLLSSWYVVTFVVFTAYQLWWSLVIRPNLPDFYYSSIAGAIALSIGLVILAFIIAGVLTIIYAVLLTPESEPPP